MAPQKNVFDLSKLQKLAAWADAEIAKKQAFVDPAAMGGAPPAGGAPPMDPSMMGGAPPMDPAMMGGAPPMDPAAMGGAPPMDPAMAGTPPAEGMPMGDPMMAAPPGAAPPPPDPAMQTMGSQEALRNIIAEEIRKAMGGGEGGVMAGGGVKKSNKNEEMMHLIEEKLENQTKILVTALKDQGIEIPLSKIYALENNGTTIQDTSEQQAAGQSGEQGISESLVPGMTGASAGQQAGKMANWTNSSRYDSLKSLAETRDSLQRSALAMKMGSCASRNLQAEDLSYLNGLFS